MELVRSSTEIIRPAFLFKAMTFALRPLVLTLSPVSTTISRFMRLAMIEETVALFKVVIRANSTLEVS